eukprot:5040579-Prymnesium_polylepis.1
MSQPRESTGRPTATSDARHVSRCTRTGSQTHNTASVLSRAAWVCLGGPHERASPPSAAPAPPHQHATAPAFLDPRCHLRSCVCVCVHLSTRGLA